MMNLNRVQAIYERWFSNKAYFLSALAMPVAVVMMVCSFLLASCSGTPVDHPLVTGTPTFDIGTSTSSGRGSVAPIQVVQSSLTAYPGGTMSLAITTSPYAVCSLAVAYGHSKPSPIPGAAPATASSSGAASWKWFVETNAHTGTWPLTISANLANGAKATAQINVTVVFPPLGIVSTDSKLAVHPGGVLKLSLQMGPNENASVTYAFGAGKTPKTLTGRSSGKGLVTFYWGVASNTPKGTYTATASEILADGEQASIAVTVVIN